MYHKQFLSKHERIYKKLFYKDIVHTYIPFCLDKSSAFSIGVIILSTVKNAAKLAVYDEMIIRVKNHQIPPTILVEAALGFNPDPCRRNVPVMNQKEFEMEN